LSGLLDIPSVVLTSRRQNVSACDGAAVTVLEKPFTIEEILPAVEQAAERIESERFEAMSARLRLKDRPAARPDKTVRRRGAHHA
jgi:hypothetical protein